MDTEIITKELEKFNVTEAAIAMIRDRYMALTIKGIDDRAGYEACHRARMDVKNRRVSVQKTGKALREDANAFAKAVISEEKRIIGLLDPIESHLQDEESRVDEEKERIKREAEEKIAAALQERVNALFALNCRFDGQNYSYGDLVAPLALIKVCTDDQFTTFVAAITEKVEAEQAAKATEEAARKAESDRLAKIAQEQEEERQRLAVEAKKIQDERDRLARGKKEAEEAKEREGQAKVRAAELEKAKAEAAETARIETEARLKRKVAEKEAREKAEAEARAKREEEARIRAEKREARRPDKQKLSMYVDAVFGMAMFEMKTEDGKVAAGQIQKILGETEKRIREIIEQL